MPDNPTSLKEDVARAALERLEMDDPVSVASKVADPMILFVCGMLQAATESAYVALAGGTQMLAVLALASKLGYDHTRAVLATTSYIAEDPGIELARRGSTRYPPYRCCGPTRCWSGRRMPGSGRTRPASPRRAPGPGAPWLRPAPGRAPGPNRCRTP